MDKGRKFQREGKKVKKKWSMKEKGLFVHTDRKAVESPGSVLSEVGESASTKFHRGVALQPLIQSSAPPKLRAFDFGISPLLVNVASCKSLKASELQNWMDWNPMELI